MRRKVWWAAGAALGALAVYATVVEPRWLELTRRRVHIRGLPDPFEGLRIALLTDLHVGGLTRLSLVRRAVQLAMDAQPHLIALTGDFTTDDAPGFAHVVDALDELHAPLGVYAVPGNHDYIVGIDDWHRQIGAHPVIEDLTNHAIVRDVGGARVCVAGVDDYYMGTPRLVLPDPATRDLTILLAHSPDQAERSRRAYDAIDLVLSGHTHAGQVRLPIFGAPVTAAVYGDLYESGLRRRPWTQVYTSRGIGTIGMPLRLFARPEVAILELTGRRRPPLPEWRASLRNAPSRLPRMHMRGEQA